ncbi:transmembrane protein 71 isoform X2 [Spea bombifrons]|uniref:transmembrane protein 71 isoform X2 n=1 Tax=Spea bombifrons TaxID=233779 RepID=UPI00234A4CB3|nr:transmembrane protein 71 isoform X2 [Spea bombifrons]
MDPVSLMMSTPKSERHLTFFWEFTHPQSKFDDSTSNFCQFLDMDVSRETTNRSTSCELFSECRHSPRLLTNGYYIWNEGSCLCNTDANVSISPAKLKVPYKETLVRIFPKRRRRMDLRFYDTQEAEKSLQCVDLQQEDDSEHKNSEIAKPCCLKYTADNVEKDNQSQGPPVHFSAADAVCGNKEPSSWKSYIQTVTLFFLCFSISMWARSWLTKLLANLLTSVMVLSIICFAFPHPGHKRPSQINQNVNHEMLPPAPDIHMGFMTSSSSKLKT